MGNLLSKIIVDINMKVGCGGTAIALLGLTTAPRVKQVQKGMRHDFLISMFGDLHPYFLIL